MNESRVLTLSHWHIPFLVVLGLLISEKAFCAGPIDVVKHNTKSYVKKIRSIEFSAIAKWEAEFRADIKLEPERHREQIKYFQSGNMHRTAIYSVYNGVPQGDFVVLYDGEHFHVFHLEAKTMEWKGWVGEFGGIWTTTIPSRNMSPITQIFEWLAKTDRPHAWSLITSEKNIDDIFMNAKYIENRTFNGVECVVLEFPGSRPDIVREIWFSQEEEFLPVKIVFSVNGLPFENIEVKNIHEKILDNDTKLFIPVEIVIVKTYPRSDYSSSVDTIVVDTGSLKINHEIDNALFFQPDTIAQFMPHNSQLEENDVFIVSDTNIIKRQSALCYILIITIPCIVFIVLFVYWFFVSRRFRQNVQLSAKLEKECEMSLNHPPKVIKTRIVDYSIILSCCILLLCVGIQVRSYVAKPPELTIPDKILDFGVIPAGIPTAKFVSIMNSGGNNLVIQNVRAGCGCIEIKVHNNVLNAGQQSAIEVVLTGESRPVNKSLDIYVFSNDKRHPIQHVVVQYSSISEQFFEPSQLDFGVIHKDRLPVDRSLRIIDPKNDLVQKSINNIDVFTSAEFMEGRAKFETNLSRCILVTLNNNAPVGEFYEHLDIADATHGLRYHINVVGSVRGEVYAIPKVLDYGEINRNISEKIDTIVLHSRNTDLQISILSVNTSENLESFVFPELDSEDKSKLNVRLSTRHYGGAWATTEISGSLVISCIDSQERSFSINIPVRFHMKAERVLDE